MTSKIATLTQKDDLSIITLDDGKANAFSSEMILTLNELLALVPRDKGALVIKGRDGIFSGGFDLKTLAAGDMQQIFKMVSLGYKLLLELFSFERPIVAAVSGHSIALGLFVTCCADYRIGKEGSFICQANEVRNNMDIPVQIMEIIKARVNKNYFYSAVYHSEAYSMEDSILVGYIDQVVSSETFTECVIEKAKDLASLPHPYYANSKKAAQHDIVEKIDRGIKKYERQIGIE
jgi:enoyl-CoA hydratase